MTGPAGEGAAPQATVPAGATAEPEGSPAPPVVAPPGTTAVPHPVAPAARSRAKRALDVAIVLAVSPLLIPVSLVVALLVRLTSPGPALFRQERVGLRGDSFRILKFRTMTTDAEDRLQHEPQLWDLYVSHDYKLPAALDPRVTRIGGLLRRTSLDELPQLLNVLGGSMSLVGPRPVTRAEFDACADVFDAYRAVRPGMTGYWQVNGRADVHYPDRAEYDRRYVAEWSVLGDLWILVRTPITVVRGRGAF